MFLKNYHHLKNKEILISTFLFLISIFSRIPVIVMFGDTSLEHEWQHLVYNLINNGKLVWQTFDNGFLLPNLWMPPLYAYYLYAFSFFGLENQDYIFLILLSQVFLSSISVVIFYKINTFFFSNKISFYSSFLFSVFPLHLYACGQVSSISLQTFLTIIFIYFFFNILKKKNIQTVISFSVVGGLLILLRGEFWFIYLLSIIYLFLFLKVPLKKIFLIFLISAITASPYLIRNFLIFEKITVLNSFGYNLWKGNHPFAKEKSSVAGSMIVNDGLMDKVNNVEINKFYRLNWDKIFLDEAIKNIKSDPIGHFVFCVKKAFAFMFIDIKSSDKKYWHPLHYIPLLLIGVSSFFGIIFANKKSPKLNFLILFLLINIAVFSAVSILPRYRLVILPLQIIFTNILFVKIREKYFK